MFSVLNGFKEHEGRCYSFDKVMLTCHLLWMRICVHCLLVSLQRATGFVASEGCVSATINKAQREMRALEVGARIVCSLTRCAGQSASLTGMLHASNSSAPARHAVVIHVLIRPVSPLCFKTRSAQS